MSDEIRFIEGVTKFDPEINVIDKATTDERIQKVFNQIAGTLQRSLGPMGSHAIISRDPYYHITKDGFTIMKNIRYNNRYGYVDNVIAGMISDICGRLNYAVGDGTTSAVVSANSMMQLFITNDNELKRKYILPRNIISNLKKCVSLITEELQNQAIDIKTLPNEEMCKYIRDIVYISSNADEEMTNTIVELYEKLAYPAISITKALDGVTKAKFIEGFMYPAKLMDRQYINNDNDTQEGTNYDIIIFDHKVTLSTYKYIIKNIALVSRARGRKLICLAPTYDETALHGEIQNEMNAEYRQTHDMQLIIMGYRATRALDKKRINDLAMLCNTELITVSMENELIQKFSQVLTNPQDYNEESPTNPFYKFINIDERGIEGLSVGIYKKLDTTIYTKDKILDYKRNDKEGDLVLRVGFVGKASLSFSGDSIFSDFRYDQALYDMYLKNAEKELSEIIEKYKRLGTFNFEIDDAQRRYLGLKMEMGTIEVGASSDFSQEFAMDAFDDAVKAAQSAYRNGVVIGSHVSLLKAIDNVAEKNLEDNSDIMLLLAIIRQAFKNVRFAVLGNGFNNTTFKVFDISDDWGVSDFLSLLAYALKVNIHIDSELVSDEDIRTFMKQEFELINGIPNQQYTYFDIISDFEVSFNVILDLGVKTDDGSPYMEFNKNVLNSVATDKEILIASADLVGLLSTGNQLVISRGNQGY